MSLKRKIPEEDDLLNFSPKKKRIVLTIDLISQNIPLSDDTFIAIAKEFGQNIGISDMEFSYSKGWLENLNDAIIFFKER